jgi:ribosomal protein S18 acetylase RimI-like enzyme
VDVIDADLECREHQAAVLQLIDAYASDAMGDGRGLSDEVRANLIPGLRSHPAQHIFLAYESGLPVGIAVCFRGFSTFRARPLLNVHDLAVLPAYRGQGIGRRLLERVMAKARDLGCCAVTLEVGEHNVVAQALYRDVGFEEGDRQSAAGRMLFWKKPV